MELIPTDTGNEKQNMQILIFKKVRNCCLYVKKAQSCNV